MKNTLILTSILFMVLISGTAFANIEGACAGCHTMHNSQGGNPLLDSEGVATSTNSSLLKQDCVGCHTGTNTTLGKTPFVTDTGDVAYGPDYTYGETDSGTSEVIVNGTGVALGTLAGGTFKYVNGDHSTGHNVSGLDITDAPIGQEPPGWIDGWGTSNIGNAWSSNQLTCAGTYGCHGDHSKLDSFESVRGAHHGDDSIIDGSSITNSFRFLDGIIGYEDADWEFTVSSTDHNQYYGVGNTLRSEVITEPTLGAAGKGEGISTFCGTCHANFHTGNTTTESDYILYDADGALGSDAAIGTSPWLRHPTDYALATAGSEYLEYGDISGTVGTYNVIVPVATSAKNGNVVDTMVSTGIKSDATKSIITCLSCHRAHGSPYADLLRWDYSKITAGFNSSPTAAGNPTHKGCFVCHTTKD